LCSASIPGAGHARTVRVDAVVRATDPAAVGFLVDLVGGVQGAAPLALSTVALPATASGGRWTSTRVQGELLVPADASSQVVARLRRDPASAATSLAQAQCTLRVRDADERRPGAPRTRTLNASLASPWGLAFLPDGRMIVTQKGGTMVLLSADGATVLAALTGVPTVDASGQGGLLDVALDPDFDGSTNAWIYWTYSEPGPGGAGTAVARGRLVGTSLQDVAVIFRQLPKVGGSGHYGSRLAFRGDGTLLVTLGERQLDNPANPGVQYAQNVANHLGKVVRFHRDGSIPVDNPSFGAGAQPALWSIGHRNPQGAAIHPATGELWLLEHGPQGGDELNRVVPGGNYGWPLASYGCPYGAPVGTACRVGGGTHAPTYVEPAAYWVPTSIAPAGMTFYTGTRFPEWHGNVLFGALAGTALWRVALDGNGVASRERLFGTLGERIRNVRQGPDGWLYLLTDSGKLIRVER
jgi:glucose/arabinose dehydrogenase